MGLPCFWKKTGTTEISSERKSKTKSKKMFGSKKKSQKTKEDREAVRPRKDISFTHEDEDGQKLIRNELEEVFRKFDANGDGKISRSELREVLKCLGQTPSDEELHAMVAEADLDGDGFIDKHEFMAVNMKASDQKSKEDDEEWSIRDAFKVFDKNKDGCISADELHDVLNSLGETCNLEDCKRMINGVDSDGDGRVNYQEFRAMMLATSSSSTPFFSSSSSKNTAT